MSAADVLINPTYPHPKPPIILLCILCRRNPIFAEELDNHLNSEVGSILGYSALIGLILSPKTSPTGP
ncbi:hypothetical protein BOTBODRAFT_39291 [Botryobasidium botryosum FD-172 SS1]|uniref:Uncharacterized protein n=1 Tax=Botryobasidium botryosum (strain FD-172 SS1) TaxID=930990 RepID=A0A067LUA6_BOTB1|nr:hypothetical protein BOTBODRAFT_39291 [Botryobasidium botryosum FD-172 SS1]